MLENLAAVVGCALILLFLTLFFVNWQIAKSIWSPFYTNLNSIKQFSLNTLKPVLLTSTGISEFDELNQVVSDLTEQVISDYRSLKQFSEDASHEIQTPLAIIKSKIETLINSNGLKKKHVESLQLIFSAVHRLSRLNKDLLLLMKIENKQFHDVRQMSFKKIIEEKMNEFQELSNLKQLQVQTLFIQDLFIEINPVLADILINNLLSNAINHNIKGGILKIEMDHHRILFINSGKGPLLDPECIFNRFHKENTSSHSVGLGLAIVKKICDLHRIQITYDFIENLHCFRLAFKL